MSTTPVRVANRIASTLKTFQPVLESAKNRDVNESDTVIIVTDLLSEMFGYDKYSELTSEVAIRGTYCDLAIKVDGEVQFLIEVKAIGSELKDNHTRQAVDYAATEGVDWVVLTNAATWKVYKVSFGKPIEPELVVEFDLLTLDSKSDDHIGSLFLLSKEGFNKDALCDYDAQRAALSRYCIGALLLSEPVLNLMRKQLRLLSPDVRITMEQVRGVLLAEVLKREVLEGDRAAEAHRHVAKVLAKVARAKAPVLCEATPDAQPTSNVPEPVQAMAVKV